MNKKLVDFLDQTTNAGCSSFSWETKDGKHLWGRNFDFNRFADGTYITFVPREKEYYTCGSEIENNLETNSKAVSKYSMIGMGSLVMGKASPVMYEAINEKGLMGGQLYYRGYAHYKSEVCPGTQAVQGPYLITHVIAQCATVAEVVDLFKSKITVVSTPIMGHVPMTHWIFTDKSGEAIVIEMDADGLHIYRNTMGVLTNSPDYNYQKTNLLNYANLRNEDFNTININGAKLPQVFSGNGMQGLPGDWTAISRFVRLSFLKKYGEKGKDEEQGIDYMFRLFTSVAFPMGLIKVTNTSDISKYDQDIVPYDYTVYTACMCAESLKYYWMNYENTSVNVVDLNEYKDEKDYIQFDILNEQHFIKAQPLKK